MLMIIDMQPSFEAARDKDTIAGVCEQVQIAKANGDRIVVVEYESYGPTLEPIIDEIGDYDNVLTVQKEKDDGSAYIAQDLQENGWKIADLVKICGVNTLACVLRTAAGLAFTFPAIKIHTIKTACNDNLKGRAEEVWKFFMTNLQSDLAWRMKGEYRDQSIYDNVVAI